MMLLKNGLPNSAGETNPSALIVAVIMSKLEPSIQPCRIGAGPAGNALA